LLLLLLRRGRCFSTPSLSLPTETVVAPLRLDFAWLGMRFAAFAVWQVNRTIVTDRCMLQYFPGSEVCFKP
jgi:hypothetical protein